MKNPFLKIKELLFWADNFLYKIPVIGKRLYLRQLVKFVISGGLLTLLDFAIYVFLTRVFLFWETHYLWANFISMSVGAVANFILNKNWVFRDQGRNVASQYLKFWIVGGIGGMVFYQFLLYAFVETGHVYDLLGKALAAVIVLFFRFGVQKFWIFK